MNRREYLFSAVSAATIFSASGASGASAAQQGGAISKNDARKLQDSTLMVDGLDPSALTEEYLGMLEAAGVDCWHHSMGGLSSFASLLGFCDKHSDRIVPVGTVREIRQARKEGKVGHLSGWQMANQLIEDGASTLPQISNLRAYRELGLRICGLVYNTATAFGGGSLDPSVGLTRAGVRLVEEIHKQNLVLDVGGHTGEQTSFDAVEISKGVPIICSHTNLRSFIDNPRNMTDRLIEKVAETDGVIGLTTINDFHARTRNDEDIEITPQVSLEKHLDQYDYLKKLIGVDHIGMGPDFMHGRYEPGDIARIIPEIWPADVYSQKLPWLYVKDFEKITDLPNVTQGLMERGWSDSEIRKVLGENWLRVYEQVWGA